jgi:hypothetical protein
MKMRYFIPFAVAVVVAVLAWSSSLAAEVRNDAAESVRPAYPSSIESMIERRRDQMDRRRERFQDWWTGRRWHQAPWVNAQRDWMDARQDAARESYRQRRDVHDLWHDAMSRWRHPWSQWQQDWNQRRRDARELDRLARDEFFDRYQYSPRRLWAHIY